MPRLAIQLSCYNGARYVPFVLASLKAQTFQDWTLYATDNASQPEEADAIRAALAAFGEKAVYVNAGATNVDFVGAHNLLFKRHAAELVMLHNDDAVLAPDYLEKLVAAFDADPKLGAAAGRIYRWDFERAGEPDGGKTDVIDSVGLERRPTWQMDDRFGGVPAADARLAEGVESVFGVSGCLPMYRRSALAACSPDGHLFDPAYASYKEDTDLAFRLNEAGYAAATVHPARAWHRRTLGKGRPDVSDRVRLHSYRNHLWNLKTHLRGRDLLRDGWAVIPYELAKAAYYLLKRPAILVAAWRQTLIRRDELWKKRAFCARLRRSEGPTTYQLLPPTPVPSSYDISVVIVSHNDLNAACLASVDRARQASGLKVGVVVVDNASTAYEAAKVLWETLPDGAVVQRNWDAGYGSSVNIGAKALDAAYVFVLNPDTVLTDEHIFTKLVAFMKEHPQAGIAAPAVAYPDGRRQETVRRFPGWLLPLMQRTALGSTAYGQRYLHRFLMRDVPSDQTRMVDWAQGSALFLPMDHWKALGGFDDRFWMYFEDVDLCRRSWKLHRPVYYVTEARMQHAFGKESKRQGSLLNTLLTNRMARAHLLSFAKYLWKWRAEWFRTQPK